MRFLAISLLATAFLAPGIVSSAEPDIESYYNPFGDAWKSKARANPSISIALTPGCVHGPKEKEKKISGKEIKFLSQSNVRIIYSECDKIDRNQQRTKMFATALKSSSDLKIIGYHLISMVQPNENFWKIVKDREEFFLHIKGKRKTFENRLHSTNNPKSNIFMLDIGNKDFQKTVAQYIKGNLEKSNLDGFLADWVNPFPLNNSDEYRLLEDGVGENWNSSWQSLLKEVRRQVGKNKIIIANYSGSADGSVDFIQGVIPFLDGIMVEDLIGSKKTRWKDLRGGIEDSRRTIWEKVNGVTARAGKLSVLVTNTNSNCQETHSSSCFKSKTKAGERELAEYYLAAYLNIKMPKSIMFYYTPTTGGPQFLSETFFEIWDLPIGDPISNSSEIAPHIYHREFQNAHAYWNNSGSDMQLTFSRELFRDKRKYSNFNLKAESGAVFVKKP